MNHYVSNVDKSVKKQKTEHSSSSLLDSTARQSSVQQHRDCYDDVMRSIYNNNTHTLLDDYCSTVDNGIRSSWINDTDWISCIADSMDSCTNHLDNETATINDIKEEFKCVSKQLVQVKRRLSPAAENLAEVYNNNLHCNRTGNVGKINRTTVKKVFEDARRYCNPYEELGAKGYHGGLNTLFVNRAAIKLANIDAAFGFCLTPSSDPHRVSINNISDYNKIFKFVDLCAAPGGFSEYIIWRCQKNCIPATHGYSMSLMGKNEHGSGSSWRLGDISVKKKQTFVQYRICNGADGTGDIYRWDNVQYLQKFITTHSSSIQSCNDIDNRTECGTKVQLVLADGGFDAQRDVENQEQMTQKLIVCETAAALSLLQQDGTFVIKTFGFQTPIVRCVMEYLFLTFRNVIAIKPISSRPASAERYVCCSGFIGNPIGWDGRKWCDAMLMGKNNSLCPKPTQQQCYKLYTYLEQFDRDMNRLNLKACFAILTYLENESRQQTGDDNDDMETIDDSETPRININAYRYAWRLI